MVVAILGILFFSRKGRVAWYNQGLCFNQGTRSGLIIGDVAFTPLLLVDLPNPADIIVCLVP